MKLVLGIVLIALVAGSYAAPKQTQEPDNSMFFEHVDLDARIVGGVTAPQARHRHMVALSQGTLIRSLLCGGSLISQRTVLTAAHCIAAVFSFGSLTSSLRGTVGTMNWNQGGTMYQFARNVTHQHYVSATIKNDIGLLITTTNVVLSNTVAVVPMTFNFQGAGVPVRVAGWGRIVEVRQRGIELNIANVPAVEPHIELCTFHAPGRGTCNGDSGSALNRIDNGQQVGIVSWGLPCARGAPDMFVRLSAYGAWVQQHMV